jgi:tungstate transport system ATP-binding protein
VSLIETINICQKYGEREVLKNVNLKIDRSETFALIGPTGAGKTTFLRLIDLLEIPSSGRIYFNGLDVTESGRLRFEVRRQMTFVLQKPVVFNLSVYDNIAYGLKWRGRKREDIRQKVNNILELVSLAPYKSRNARTLSGGEAQRVAIARAIAIAPEVLLLDEPTANLDPVSTEKIEELIQTISRQYKTTIIMATHDLSQGRRLAHRIGVMVNGEIIQVGKADEIFSTPSNRAVAEFVGVENIIGGVIVSNEEGIATIDVSGIVIEAVSNYATGEPVSICIRPEDIILATSRPASSARNTLMAEITKVISAGALSRVELDCGFPVIALVTKRSAEELNLETKRKVYVSFKATAVHTIKR